MGSHNLIEERFTLHQMSGSLRIRSLKSLCHMGNCNLIVAILLPGTAEKHIGKKKSFCFIDFVSSANLRNFMIHDYINNTRNDFIFIFLEPCCDRFQIYPVWCNLGSMWSEDGICQTQENGTKRRQGSTSCSCNVLYQYMPSVLGTPIMLLLKYMKGERQTYQ